MPIWQVRAQSFVLVASSMSIPTSSPISAPVRRLRPGCAPVIKLDCGPCELQDWYPDSEQDLGLLVLEGVLAREVSLGGKTSPELVGADDQANILAGPAAWAPLTPERGSTPQHAVLPPGRAWGELEQDGSVRLPLALTHEMLAKLVGQSRPYVSSALRQLAEMGLVTRRDGDWILSEGLGASLAAG